MLKLEKVVLTMFASDTMIFPKETAHFGFYKNGTNQVVNITETNVYKYDLVGIKALNEAGKSSICYFTWKTIYKLQIKNLLNI